MCPREQGSGLRFVRFRWFPGVCLHCVFTRKTEGGRIRLRESKEADLQGLS